MVLTAAAISRASEDAKQPPLREGKGDELLALQELFVFVFRTPYGLTANEVANRLAASPSNISSRLSRLAAYGTIKKTRGRIAHDATPFAIYHAPIAAQSTIVRHQP